MSKEKKEEKKNQDHSSDFPNPNPSFDYKEQFRSIKESVVEQENHQAESTEDVILTINDKEYDSSELVSLGDNYGILDRESGSIVNVCTKKEFDTAYDAALEAKNKGPSFR